MSHNLPYTNADIRPKSKIINLLSFNVNLVFIPSFNAYAAHALQSMSTSAKMLLGSIAACINGIVPRAFKYTAMSICLSIIEDDLQHNRMPVKRPPIQSRMLNDVVVTFDEEKIE
jgi:hypothetical protein